jgi:hypothetical protein
MVRSKLHLALIAALVAAPLAHAAPTEMKEAPVAAAPSAKALGGAEFAIATRGPTLVALPAPSVIEARSLKSRRQDQVKHGQPFEIGLARDVPNPRIALHKLGWQRLSDGRLATSFEVASGNAVAMRTALSLKALGRVDASGVTFRFGGNDGRVFEMNGREFTGSDGGWSPVTMGAKSTVEVVLARGLRPQNFALSMPQVSHLDMSPITSEAAIASVAKIGESGSCENDIVCRVSPTAGFLNAEKAVARMLFTKGGASYLCTGTLLNNTNATKRHLFWSAAHCISTQKVASTLQTYWFYKATTCGGTTQAPGAVTLTGGANLLFANTTRDTLLLELKTAPPAGAFYAGWTSTAIGATGTAIEGIHHPAGDAKMYSLGSVTGLSTTIDRKSPLYQVVWNSGVTEGGSSGSALFKVAADGTYQLTGGLYGGYSFCSAPSDPDYYSRFADVYSSIATYFGP